MIGEPKSDLAESWGIDPDSNDEHDGEMDGDGIVSYPKDKPRP